MSSPYEPYPEDESEESEESGGYGQWPNPPQGGWGTGWVPSQQQGYLQGGPVGFGEAISQGFKNFAAYNGRASRSAYWWFFLFSCIIGVVIGIAGNVGHVVAVQFIVSVILTAVGLSLSVRRLHDTGRSAFWLFIALIPFIGAITLFVFYCLSGTPGPNKYDIQG